MKASVPLSDVRSWGFSCSSPAWKICLPASHSNLYVLVRLVCAVYCDIESHTRPEWWVTTISEQTTLQMSVCGSLFGTKILNFSPILTDIFTKLAGVFSALTIFIPTEDYSSVIYSSCDIFKSWSEPREL